MDSIWAQTQDSNVAADQAFESIDLQVAGISLSPDIEDTFGTALDSSLQRQDDASGQDDDTYHFDSRARHFDFDRLLKYQYVEFADYDIPDLLKLLVSISQTHPHMTSYPAALIYQCIRYAHHKEKSPELVDLFTHLSITKILSTVGTNPTANLDPVVAARKEEDSKNKSSPTQFSGGDIVLQSYWLGALSFLYYYLCRDESFYKKYPAILQEIINALHSTMVQLVSSIHSRLTVLIEPTLLDYTTIKDVKQKLYKNDWNFFKKRKAAKQQLSALKNKERSAADGRLSPVSSISGGFQDDEVLKHLFPPSPEDQMKPSPLKIVQTFGALAYVLDLHQLHPVFQQQCLSMAVDWFSKTLFNRIIKDKKKKCLSRAHAIQIRLNLSTLENWIKNNDIVLSKPLMIDDFMWQRFPYTLVAELSDINIHIPILKNVAMYRPYESANNEMIYDTSNSIFYYQSFHRIAQIHLEPVFQLLQWLQVATTLDTEDSLNSTMHLLQRLTPLQLLKSIEHYNYEVDEHKFKTILKKKLSLLVKERKDVDTAIYLPERQVPLLVLPTIPELTDTFAKDTSLQPFMPIDVEDTANEIHETHSKERQQGAQLHESEEEDEEKVEEEEEEEEEEGNGNEQDADDELDNWGSLEHNSQDSKTAADTVWTPNIDIEANPW